MCGDAMSTTEIEICNNALALSGQGNHIQSLDDETKEADACKRVLSRAIERCVDKYDWSFCRKDEYITKDYLLEDVASPPFSFTYKLPEKCLRVLAINTTEPDLQYQRRINGRQTIPFDYRNYQGKKVLVTNAQAPFVLQYQELVTDVNLFPPTFIEALEYVTAGYLTIDFVKGTTGAQLGLELEKNGYNLLKQAYSLDFHVGVEPIPETVSGAYSFTRARGGYRRDY